MNAKEFSEHIGVAHGTVKRWLWEGMPADRTGTGGARSVRVRTDEAKAWIAERYPQSIAVNRKSFLYIARRDSDGALKIGFTSDVVRRIHELCKNTRSSVELVATVPGNKPEELRLHEMLKSVRVDGEWFAANETDVVAAMMAIKVGA